MDALPRASSSPTSAGNLAAPAFRVARVIDARTILSIAHDAYGARGWTPKSEAWVVAALSSPNIYCLLGMRSFGFLIVEAMFWEDRPRAFLAFFAARPKSRPLLEPLHLLCALVAYAKSRGCVTLEAGTETTFDIEPFLRRIARDKKTQLVEYSLFRLPL